MATNLENTMAEQGTNYTGTDFYCDVALKGLVPLRKEYESEHVLAYHHTRPFWPVHIVVIPKKHISSFTTLSDDDTPILLEMIAVMKTLAAKVTAEHGAARILTNLGRYQDSKHLHFHINSGEPLR
jgi:histidine triad (HIT) family protein